MPAAEQAAARVSVIIPCYNCVKTLRAAVESVIAQEEIRVRIILIDDGSSDGTPALMRELDARHPQRIMLGFQRNQGPAGARNHGLRLSDSEYIAFLDSDDYWAPGKLREQIAFMARNPRYGLTHTAAIKVDADGAQFQEMKIDAAYSGRCFMKLLEFNGVITSTVCMRREVIKQCGVFDDTLATRSDWEYWIRAAHDFEIGLIERPLCYYRVHEANISRLLDQTFADHKKIIQLNYERYGAPGEAKDIFDRSWFIFHSRYAARYASAGKYGVALREWLAAARLRPLDLKFHYSIARLCARSALKKVLRPVLGRRD